MNEHTHHSYSCSSIISLDRDDEATWHNFISLTTKLTKLQFFSATQQLKIQMIKMQVPHNILQIFKVCLSDS